MEPARAADAPGAAPLTRARRIGLLAVLVLLVVPGLASAAVVAVDFSRPVRAHSVVGVLHGIDMQQPPDTLVAPLAPRSWRGDLESAPFERVHAFGARYIIVVSDLWGYPGANWYGRRPPWEDLQAWGEFVRRLARAHRRDHLIWDVWNEPDQPYFWNGTREQFYATYRVAYEAVRTELGPSAVISGPSVSRFRWPWLVGPARTLPPCRL